MNMWYLYNFIRY